MLGRSKVVFGATMGALVACAAAPATASAELAVGVRPSFMSYEAVVFDTDTPTAAPRVVTIQGLNSASGPQVQGVDVRPATGEVYVLTIDNGGAADDSVGQVHRLNLNSGALTAVGTAFSNTLEDGEDWAFDFNPMVDRIRVASTASTAVGGSNLRVHPDTGALVAADTALTAPVVHVGYDRSFAGTAATTLFGINAATDGLVRIGGVDSVPSPNGGVVTAVGPLGVAVGNGGGLDISAATGVAYLVDGGTMYRVNLATGTATAAGTVPGPFVGFTVLRGSTVQVGAASVTGTEASGVATITVTRTGDLTYPGQVDFATAAGTATVADFTPTAGSLSFPAGVASRTVNVPITNDSAVEGSEAFTFTLAAPTGGTTQLGAAATTTVTITSDDVAPTPPAAPAVDAKAPVVLINPLVGRTRATFNRSGLAVTFSASEASTSTLTLRLGTVVVGTATRTLRGPGVTRVTLTITQAGKSALATRLGQVRAATLVLTQRTADAAGNARTTRANLVVRR